MLAVLGLIGLALAWWLESRHGFRTQAALLSAGVVLLVFLVTLHTLTFLLAWLYGSPSPQGHGLRGLTALKPWWGELISAGRDFLFLQPFFGDRLLPSGSDPGRPALLLVHGYLCNRAMWTHFARDFAARGHIIESVNLEPVYGSIDAYAAIIQQGVEKLRLGSGQQKVVLIGHSMGGLAIRAYLRDYGHDAVRKVITLGTPHRGTWGAQLGQGRNAFQMRLDTPLRPNAWLQQLRSIEGNRLDNLLEILLTHHDNIVYPQAIQTLGKAPVHEFSGMGHLEMPDHPDVRAKVAEILGRC